MTVYYYRRDAHWPFLEDGSVILGKNYLKYKGLSWRVIEKVLDSS